MIYYKAIFLKKKNKKTDGGAVPITRGHFGNSQG